MKYKMHIVLMTSLTLQWSLYLFEVIDIFRYHEKGFVNDTKYLPIYQILSGKLVGMF